MMPFNYRPSASPNARKENNRLLLNAGSPEGVDESPRGARDAYKVPLDGCLPWSAYASLTEGTLTWGVAEGGHERCCLMVRSTRHSTKHMIGRFLGLAWEPL